jgi:hypothetical protein
LDLDSIIQGVGQLALFDSLRFKWVFKHNRTGELISFENL